MKRERTRDQPRSGLQALIAAAAVLPPRRLISRGPEGTPIGEIGSRWRARDQMTVALKDAATWANEGQTELAPGAALQYVAFAFLFDSCSGYDTAWHFFRILEGPAAGRTMVLYSPCFEPPVEFLGPLVVTAGG